MSRRPANNVAERAAHNQQTLKTLVKIESNKSCADCKKNKHPRWASWNLGIFICIRCSGIHRGMGTHISRVKSVDLDSWTDEQLQSMLKWGNSRANKYWEAKLAPGHVPAEAKIENYIRTKYDSKRWVMEGGIPDPSTLDGDDDSEVAAKEVSLPVRAEPTRARPPPINKRPNEDVDLFGGNPLAEPTLSTTSAQTMLSAPMQAKPEASAPRPSKPAESLLGFDFFSPQTTPPSRPASTGPSAATSSSTSRPDLKQSILSLYSSVPRPPVVTQEPTISAGAPASNTSANGLDDTFSNLNFGGPTPLNATVSVPKAQAAPSILTSQRAVATSPIVTPPTNTQSGGNFFNAKPRATNNPSATPTSTGIGGFTSPPKAQQNLTVQSNNGLDDLLGFSTISAPPMPAVSMPTAATSMHSPFNLSQKPLPMQTSSDSVAHTTQGADLANPWGASSTDAWSAPAPVPPVSAGVSVPPSATKSASIIQQDSDWGWSTNAVGSSKPYAPHITGDDDFGSWESSTTPAPAQTVAHGAPRSSKPGGFGGGEDLFSNVWE